MCLEKSVYRLQMYFVPLGMSDILFDDVLWISSGSFEHMKLVLLLIVVG